MESKGSSNAPKGAQALGVYALEAKGTKEHGAHMRFKILVHKSMQREYEVKRKRTGGIGALLGALKGLVKWHW